MLKSKFNTKFVDKGYKKALKQIEEMKDIGYIKIGILSQDGDKKESGDDLNLAGIAAVHEFGTKKAGKNKNVVIPERSFLRSTMDEKRGHFLDITYKAMVRITSLNADVYREMNLIGLAIAEAVKSKITNGPFTPNAPSTIKAKGSSRPLIDTGRLRASIRHEVVSHDEEAS